MLKIFIRTHRLHQFTRISFIQVYYDRENIIAISFIILFAHIGILGHTCEAVLAYYSLEYNLSS
mgnify:CR=1 FL=1